ncbi:MAG: hypothetical protein JRD89_01130 [Deltaproteobacteria bacterium]|nr:hypothetical protein [Deltaproteobacteria bacterium]
MDSDLLKVFLGIMAIGAGVLMVGYGIAAVIAILTTSLEVRWFEPILAIPGFFLITYPIYYLSEHIIDREVRESG